MSDDKSEPEQGSAKSDASAAPIASSGAHAPPPGTTTILLVRHAESAANAAQMFGSQSDTPLTERGRLQSSRLSAALANVRVDHVYSSDLSRARDTVAPIAQARGLTVIERAAFRERSVGELTGLSFDLAKERFPDAWRVLVTRDPDGRPPGGESLRDLQARLGHALDEVVRAHAGRAVLIGSHGGAIVMMTRYLLGVRELEVPMAFAVSNASVTRIDLVPAGATVMPRLVYGNRVAPLEDEPHFH
ncbi:MAG: histidine phosphatase family protein [Polyangiales bacterium]